MASYDDREGKIWFDGKMVDWRSANVHILSHALHYASSVFEGERAYGGKIFLSQKHSERLHFSASELEFEIPYSVADIEDAKKEVLEVNGLTDAYVRPVAWRGSGEDMGVSADRNPVHLAIAAWKWGAYYGKSENSGARLDISRWRRPSPETIPVFAKASGLYMICTTSKHRAENQGYSDALFLDYRGYVAEATGANIFFVKDGEVHTPKPDCFLNGLTRQTVINILKEKNIPIYERHINPEEIEGFEQCFLTGSAAEVTPVSQIKEHTFEIGSLTSSIVEAYNDLVRS